MCEGCDKNAACVDGQCVCMDDYIGDGASCEGRFLIEQNSQCMSYSGR